MTLEAAASLWVLISLAWATFALGLMCGVFFTSRKDASNDNSNKDEKKDPNWWHTVGSR